MQLKGVNHNLKIVACTKMHILKRLFSLVIFQRALEKGSNGQPVSVGSDNHYLNWIFNKLPNN